MLLQEAYRGLLIPGGAQGRRWLGGDDKLNCVSKDDNELPGDGRQGCEPWVTGRGAEAAYKRGWSRGEVSTGWRTEDTTVAGGSRGQAGEGAPRSHEGVSFIQYRSRRRVPAGRWEFRSHLGPCACGEQIWRGPGWTCGAGRQERELGRVQARCQERWALSAFSVGRKNHPNAETDRTGVGSLRRLGGDGPTAANSYRTCIPTTVINYGHSLWVSTQRASACRSSKTQTPGPTGKALDQDARTTLEPQQWEAAPRRLISDPRTGTHSQRENRNPPWPRGHPGRAVTLLSAAKSSGPRKGPDTQVVWWGDEGKALQFWRKRERAGGEPWQAPQGAIRHLAQMLPLRQSPPHWAGSARQRGRQWGDGSHLFQSKQAPKASRFCPLLVKARRTWVGRGRGLGRGNGAHQGPSRSFPFPPVSRLVEAMGTEGGQEPGPLADPLLSNPRQGSTSSMWQGPRPTPAGVPDSTNRNRARPVKCEFQINNA